MTFSKIKHGIPVPALHKKSGGRKGVTQDGPSMASMLKKLEIGDSFSISGSEESACRSHSITRSKEIGIKITTRWDDHKQHLTVWRLA